MIWLNRGPSLNALETVRPGGAVYLHFWYYSNTTVVGQLRRECQIVNFPGTRSLAHIMHIIVVGTQKPAWSASQTRFISHPLRMGSSTGNQYDIKIDIESWVNVSYILIRYATPVPLNDIKLTHLLPGLMSPYKGSLLLIGSKTDFAGREALSLKYYLHFASLKKNWCIKSRIFLKCQSLLVYRWCCCMQEWVAILHAQLPPRVEILWTKQSRAGHMPFYIEVTALIYPSQSKTVQPIS